MGAGRVGAEVLARHLPAERQGLEIEEPRRPLDVEQVAIGRLLQPVELGPHGRPPAQLAQQGLGEPLQHPEQGHDLAGDVVHHLDRRAHPASQEHSAHADERLAIGGVIRRGQDGADAPREVALAPDPRGGRVAVTHRRLGDDENIRRTFHCGQTLCTSRSPRLA